MILMLGQDQELTKGNIELVCIMNTKCIDGIAI